MRNVFGDNLTITLFGESHSEYIGATLDGISPGIKIDDEYIKKYLDKRRPKDGIETSRIEDDEYEFISGVFNSFTTGAPLTVLIKNKNVNSNSYNKMKSIARPSHADYVSYIKYDGFNDYRGGGHFSGRLTAPLVIMGAIVKKALEQKNIFIGTHIKKCGDINDVNFNNVLKEIEIINNKEIPVIDNIEDDIKKTILSVSKKGDSIGGILQTAITGLEVGVGEPFFSSLESKIASMCFSVGGVKGIEFGLGFDFANHLGSSCNDEFEIKDNKIITKTNNNGGINGGISNGMDIIFNVVIKPTPSIYLKQNTIDFVENKNVDLLIEGRHDPAFIRRVAVVIECITAIVLGDLLLIKNGSSYLR